MYIFCLYLFWTELKHCLYDALKCCSGRELTRLWTRAVVSLQQDVLSLSCQKEWVDRFFPAFCFQWYLDTDISEMYFYLLDRQGSKKLHTNLHTIVPDAMGSVLFSYFLFTINLSLSYWFLIYHFLIINFLSCMFFVKHFVTSVLKCALLHFFTYLRSYRFHLHICKVTF